MTKASPALTKARQAKLERDIALRDLELARLRGELVSKADADALMFKLARDYRDALQAWPARVAPLVAGQLGCSADALRDALEVEIERFLNELSDP